MIRRVPHYYKDFTCIASECKDNCCLGGWEIDIDEETAEFYKRVEGEFGDRLRDSIGRADEYCFKLKDGQCPFLDENHLCEIYQQLGEQNMGVVCTQFPRFTEYYGSIKETGIGLACEEAERIIFSDKNAFHMISEEIEEDISEDLEYDDNLGKQLFAVRDICFQILEHTETMSGMSISIHDRLIYLLQMGSKVQQLINENEYDKIQGLLNKYGVKNFEEFELQHRQSVACSTAENVSVIDGITSIIHAYQELEILNSEWSEYIEHVLEICNTDNISDLDYKALSDEFWSSNINYEYQYKNLLQYFVFRYFMKSVYDYDVFGKIQMMAANFIVIQTMDITRWLDNNKAFSFQDRIDTVHIFSREVEYSEDNIENLAEEFIFDDIFKKDNIIELLISMTNIYVK